MLLLTIVMTLVGLGATLEEETTTVLPETTTSQPTKCDVMEEFNCARACRGVQRTLCTKQGDGTYLCICYNGDIYSNHHRPDGKLAFYVNAQGRTTKAPYPYYLEPLHMERGRNKVSDPCDPRSLFRHIFAYDERMAKQKSSDVSDKVFI